MHNLTEDEDRVISLLADVWNAYVLLPREHPMESAEFCTAVHACQSIVGSRPTWRALRLRGDQADGVRQ